jgi:hypothetical protein
MAVAGLLVSASLASCSHGESYCGTLKQDRKKLAALSAQSSQKSGDGSKALSRTVSLLSDLRDNAPDDIKDDWDTLVQAIQGLADAVKASGAGPADFRGGRRPAGVTEGQFRAVRQAAAELQATPVEQATKSIEQHAQDVCKVDLGSQLGNSG